MSDLTALASRFTARFGTAIEVLPEFRGETSWKVDAARLVEVARALKDDAGFDFLIDLTGVDHLGSEPRFEVVYELCNLATQEHLRLKTWTTEEENLVPSVSSIWRTAEWHEREAFDMVGIRFSGHPDLRRILMWEGYPYHPLRRDFPLEGRPSEMPDIAFTRPAPLEGGPFVTSPGEALSTDREPRAKPAF